MGAIRSPECRDQPRGGSPDLLPDESLPMESIVHAGDDLLVLDKPAGLLCQPGLGPQLADSLITRLQRYWPQAQLVHRLDRDTSGLILVALDPLVHRGLSAQFAQRQVFKRYVADVHGQPRATEGRIALPLARRQRQPPLYGPDPAGKPCRTDWRLLAGSGQQTASHSRLELWPLTGRSHQLRVHLSAIGHPILGDPLYGPGAQSAARRLHLHATDLRCVHPRSGAVLVFASPCPF